MLTLDIVADFVCPWCFIGKRRLETALAQLRQTHPQFSCEIRWRPFFLNPDTPPAGEPYQPFLQQKFGSQEAVEALFARVREGGKPYGVNFNFEQISLRANTLQAHRLVRWASRIAAVDTLVERIFVAQFQRGEYIGDRALLAQWAGDCGFDAKAAADWLNSDAEIAELRQEARELRELGIRMVPTFIVDHREIVVGAEDPAILVAAMERAFAVNAA